MEKVDVAGGELGIYERDAYGRPVSCTYGGRVLCGIWMARWMNGQDEGSRERAWVGMGLERYGSLENGMGCTKQSPRGIALEPDGRHPNRGGRSAVCLAERAGQMSWKIHLGTWLQKKMQAHLYGILRSMAPPATSHRAMKV